MAAFAAFAPSACEAVTIKAVNGKISATTNKKGYVLVKWNAISGAQRYGIIRSTSRSLSLSKLKQMKFLKVFGKSTRSYKDTGAKLGYQYYYWYGALAGSKVYYYPAYASGRRMMEVTYNIKKYSDGKNWLKLTVNGKAITKVGVKYTVNVTGDWSFVKSEKSDGRVGYFKFKKSKGGRGSITVKVGSTSYASASEKFNW